MRLFKGFRVGEWENLRFVKIWMIIYFICCKFGFKVWMILDLVREMEKNIKWDFMVCYKGF